VGRTPSEPEKAVQVTDRLKAMNIPWNNRLSKYAAWDCREGQHKKAFEKLKIIIIIIICWN